MSIHTVALSLMALPPYPLPMSKRIIRQMDDVIISKQIDLFDWPTWSAAMERFWMPDLVYDSVYGIGKFTGLKAWFEVCSPSTHCQGLALDQRPHPHIRGRASTPTGTARSTR